MPAWLGAAFVIAAALVAAILFVGGLLRRRLRSDAAKARARRAVAGERRAAALLERAGFVIEGAQVPARYALSVDGAEQWFDVRADYVVARDRERWIAEVKTGELAPRLALPATRRQLLEYGLAFDADGVLLVDVEAERIHVVALPWRAPPIESRSRASSALAWIFIGCAVIGSVVALLR